MTRDNSPPDDPSPPSIPLRDLSRPPDDANEDLSDLGRATRFSPGHGRTGSLFSRGSRDVQYARLEVDESPVRASRIGNLSNITGTGTSEAADEPYSPINVGAFADANIGISFLGIDGPSRPSYDARQPSIITTPADGDPGDGVSIFSPQDEDDLIPLTQKGGVKPKPNSPGMNDRLSGNSSLPWVESQQSRGRSSRLGDELLTINTSVGIHRKRSSASGIERLSAGPSVQGRQIHSRENSNASRSSSPTPSPLMARANSIFREISQRVVNISNDSEMVEQSIRRKSTAHRPRRSSVSQHSQDLEAMPGPSIPTIIEPTSESHKEPNVRTEPEPPPEYELRYEPDPEPVLPVRYANPLKGKSLRIFGPDNRLRKFLLEVLTHPFIEPIILVLIIAQTVLLAVNAASDAQYLEARSRQWGRSSFDYAIMGLFILYTVEIIARIIVSGFISNPYEYSTLDRSRGFRKGVVAKFDGLVSLHRKEEPQVNRRSSVDFHPTVVRAFTGFPDAQGPGHSRQKQRLRLAHRAFLRHSFNRVDFLAVISYWISFIMQVTSYETDHHMYVFNMLSCLRILRLLGLTAGTSIILRSLKKAAPLLVNVGFLICFFWLIFGIIGVQSFKSSLRRTCVWVGDDGSGQNYTWNIAPENVQFCGGYLNASTGEAWPWLKPDGTNGTTGPKGYICPQNSLCIEGPTSIYNGTVSFDNIIQSLEMVFVVISSNTFSDIMYYLTNSDYLAAALFFAAGIVVMALWLVNLLIAVITSSFQIIREESKHSAFTTENLAQEQPEETKQPRPNRLKELFDMTAPFWILLIVVDLVIAALRSASMGPAREKLIMNTETVVTFLLLLEIILRFLCDWRNFFLSKRNWTDLMIAIVTTVMQIPPIRNSDLPYAWMSAFQIARIYRVVLAVRVTRELVMVVFGNAVGLLNLILFVFLFTLLAAILASQLFRGDLPPQDNAGTTIQVQFFDIWNSFIGMYIIFSSENWTGIMYNITQYNAIWNTAWIGAIFCIVWFVVANIIILNMFIAVIQESFDVSEDEKRLQQVKAFLKQKELSGSSGGQISLSSIFRLGRESLKQRDALEFGGATMEQLLKDAVVKDFLDENDRNRSGRPISTQLSRIPTAPIDSGTWAKLWNRVTRASKDPNPFYTDVTITRAHEEFDALAMAKQVSSATENRRRAQRQYLSRHPHYNMSLFIFKYDNPVRKLCQYLVGPSRGDERIEGVMPWKPAWYTFSTLTYAAIVAMVIIACITTPLYQQKYFDAHHSLSNSWMVWTDMGFAILFTIEALVKIIADGFFFTPNAYFRNVWGVIDVVVLVSLWVGVFSQIFSDDSISRGIGAFKALRALRLLNISDTARNTFHSVIIVGGYKILSAAFVSLSLLIPFAILGVNLFNGKMQQCNDQGFAFSNLTDCVGEWNSTPSNWPVLAPRVVSNPYYDFDDFGSALFILFQIVSQEGWTGVLGSAMSITARGLQPQSFASQGNAVYFIVFNLLGAVFVLTLFISVFIRNTNEQTGMAYLTSEQRSWLELRKLLKQISPTKKSIHDNSKKWRKWCYDRSAKKRGKWQRFMTGLLLFHITLLLIEFYPEPEAWEMTRELIFFFLTLMYIANIVIRIVGLTWHRFRRSSWDLFSLPAVFGSFVTSLMALIQVQSRPIDQLHKLFLVSITFLLIPRNNQLDQLFKTAAASLPIILNLLATWFVLFLVYAIALTQAFGLTRFAINENGNINFRTVPKALILLFRTSIGEGWNQFMEDFATIEPPFCVIGDNFLHSDCGSAAWARGLFASWNIISMYIFVSLFVSMIFESFSYVYQRSGDMSIISRDEIRRFKQAWSEFDPNGTGFVSKEKFPRLLGELSGVFQMRIYEGDFTVHNILTDTAVQLGEPLSGRRIVHGIDLDRFNERISHIPVDEIRRRRARMDIFYQEMLLSADPDRGVSFSSCLMILAHYNVINDSKSLRLEEFLRRRARLQRVVESIRRDTVIGFLNTIYWTRRFKKAVQHRHNSSLTGPPQLDIPEIFVEDPDDSSGSNSGAEPHDFTESAPLQSPRSTPPKPPRIETTISRPGSLVSRPSLSPRGSYVGSSTSPRKLSAIDTSYAGPSTTPPQTPTLGRHVRALSTVSTGSSLGVMESFDNSAWGESIRRSFTTKRHSEN